MTDFILDTSGGQTGNEADFPPLTVTLGDDGKVHLREG